MNRLEENFLLASKECDVLEIKKCIDAGVNVDVQNGYGQTALMISCSCQEWFLPIIENLMKTNADLDINKIIEERLIDIAKLFHGTKTKISSIDKNGRTIIDYAKTLEHTKLCEILEFLLDEETEIRFKGNTDAINLSNEDSFLLNGR